MNKRRLYSLSKIATDSKKTIDSVAERQEKLGNHNNMELLMRCNRYWNNLEKFRKERERAKRYTYSDQWGDVINVDGVTMTESQYILRQGNIPLKNNLIRRLVNNVTGLYARSKTEPVCTARDRDEQQISEMMTIALQCNWQTNKMEDLLTVGIEELLISGSVFMRETYDTRNEIKDAYTDICNPDYMFFDSEMQDPRHWDISCIGQMHDIPFAKLVSTFAKNKEDYANLRDKYSAQQNSGGGFIDDITEKHEREKINFFTPSDNSLCRVYEIWTLETKERYRCHDLLSAELYKIEISDLPRIEQENKDRIKQGLAEGMAEEDIPLIKYEYIIDNYWWYQFLAPNGDVLEEGETPYWHKQHPYTLLLYPFVSGEVHPFVSDVIDQQRTINRLFIMLDMMMRTSAKGVTIVPKDVLGTLTPEQFAKNYVAYDGLVFYEPTAGHKPEQLANHTTDLGIKDILSMQFSLMEDISGVHGALQGKTPYSGTSASLYAQQSQNASTSLATLLSRFSSFTEDVAVKKVKTIQQFYEEPRYINIAGASYRDIKQYKPNDVRDINFDLSIKESTATPAYIGMANDILMELWRNRAITVEQLLQNGSFPFADRLLQSINTTKEQAVDTMKEQGVGENKAEQIAENTPQETVQQMVANNSAQ